MSSVLSEGKFGLERTTLATQAPNSNGTESIALKTLAGLRVLLLPPNRVTPSQTSSPGTALAPVAELNAAASAGATAAPLSPSSIVPELIIRRIKQCLRVDVEFWIAEKNKTNMPSLNAQVASRAIIPWLKRIDKFIKGEIFYASSTIFTRYQSIGY